VLLSVVEGRNGAHLFRRGIHVMSELDAAIEKARKLEMDGAEYYTKVAEKCAVESGRRMFESFANDERRHLKIIEDVAKGIGVDISSMPMPRDEIQTIFAHADEKVGEKVVVSADERGAVRVAMGMETESYNLYIQCAEVAEDDVTRDLYRRLSREENQHYEMLENTLEYLETNDAWFLDKEWALIVGDQSSLGSG